VSRSLTPRTGPLHHAAAPWVMLGLLWGGIAVLAGIWGAAWLAARISGGRVAPFGAEWVADLLAGRTDQAWPQTPTWLVVVFACLVVLLLLALAAGGIRLVLRRRTAPDDPVSAITRGNPIATEIGPEATRAQAVKLRADLKRLSPTDVKKLPEHELGLPIGKLLLPRGRSGPTLFASWEDTILAIMAPRAGKTTSLAIPYILGAPGPVIATSNKRDLWDATSQLRASDTDQTVWLFDPQSITRNPQGMWWNPLAAITSYEEANRAASHFVQTVADEKQRDLWGPAAQELLCALLLAAAHAGETVETVALWLDDELLPTPSEILDEMGQVSLASSLRGVQAGAPDTRAGIYQTARTAARCLRDPQITAWVTPQNLPQFDPDTFVASRQTLYLMSKAGGGSAAPLVAALTDRVMRAAEAAAERQGGRLAVPLVAVLDEAANVCRINDLPLLYSHFGSRGIIPVTILQSRRQGVSVWGEEGFDSLWGAATRKVIGAGIDDPALARDLSAMIGHHDVATSSLSYGSDHVGESVSLRRQEIMDAAAVRALPKGTALLLATGLKPTLVKLLPWYQGPRATEIAAAIKKATQ